MPAWAAPRLLKGKMQPNPPVLRAWQLPVPTRPWGDEEGAAHLKHGPKQPPPGSLELPPGGPGAGHQQRPASTHRQGQGEGEQTTPQPLPPPPPAGQTCMGHGLAFRASSLETGFPPPALVGCTGLPTPRLSWGPPNNPLLAQGATSPPQMLLSPRYLCRAAQPGAHGTPRSPQLGAGCRQPAPMARRGIPAQTCCLTGLRRARGKEGEQEAHDIGHGHVGACEDLGRDTTKAQGG